MKKLSYTLIVILLLAGIVGSMAACDGGGQPAQDPPPQPVESREEMTEAPKTEAPKTEEADETGEEPEVDMSFTYIGNKNTKKFHLTTCDSAAQIKMKNRVYFKSRKEAIDQGYEPCKNCNP